MNLKIISAGAGSGKTYRLTSEMVQLLKGGVRASGIIATTFTNKAAAELQERVRVRLLEEGLTEQADELTNALIGTVHGLGVKLLKRFAFEAGVSPEVAIIADEDQQIMFNNALATVLTQERVERMERLCDKLGLNKKDYYDWRKEVRQITDVARANAFDSEVLKKSAIRSVESFKTFLGEESGLSLIEFHEKLWGLLNDTIEQLENNEDSTKTTRTANDTLKQIRRQLERRGSLYWYECVKISKVKVGAKSRDDIEELKDYVQKHDQLAEFHQDIQDFIENVFALAMEAIREYDDYKKSRGLIDYTDMEVHIKELLKNKAVQEVLSEELDLLMVDEFQDTSPIQLEIFLKLSKFAKHSIWVGDPKQSIYGFRGADPALMQAVIQKTGGVKPEDIQEHSWRSREDIVFATNALFTKAFDQLPAEQVALKPKRRCKATADSINKIDEPFEVGDALQHWHFQLADGGNRIPGKPWMENCIAECTRKLIEGQTYIQPKGEKEFRPALPGDVAILCRSNKDCQEVANALHRAGLKAAISRSGLLNTAEAKLILACLKFILNKYDSLSIAEILLLAGEKDIEEIIEDRLAYLEIKMEMDVGKWAESHPFIQHLNELRSQVIELSSSEILNLLLEELDLRRVIVSWGKTQQRLDNVDVLRKMALQYEEGCNRLHSAASLGGFLLWLNIQEGEGKDMQGSGEGSDAVNVLTYHKSKGLEYPIVICHSLEQPLRAEVWGIEIVSESEEVDLDNVLGNRWLRYWQNPYSDQYRKTQLEERIDASTAKAQARERALQEEARVLYVGVTRARDYLIFPSRATKATKWLNRVWHQGNETYPTLDPSSFESPWEWDKKFLNIHSEIFPFTKEFPHAEPITENIVFIEKTTGKQAYTPYEIDLTKESLDDNFNIRVNRGSTYGIPLKVQDEEEEVDVYAYAKAYKAFLAADSSKYPLAERLNMGKAIIRRYDLQDSLEAAAMIQSANKWFSVLKNDFQPTRIYRKYPVQYQWKKRSFSTIIDLILETPNGLVIIQNSGFVGEPKKYKSKAQELGSWLQMSKMAVQEIFETPTIKTYVHFVMNASLVEVEISLRGVEVI